VACSWYVATTQVSSEERAQRELRNQDYETNLPMALVERLVRGALVDVLRPLFTGYIFVRFDPDIDSWRSICYTYGVRGLLGYNVERDRPPPVPRGEMEALFERLAQHGGVVKLSRSLPAYVPPSTVLRILFGPYKDHFASVEMDRGARIDTLLRFAGASRPASLPRACVELAGEPAPVAASAAVR